MLTACAAAMLALALGVDASSDARGPTARQLCAKRHAGERCRPGRNRPVPACSTCTSHKGWPRISGVIWQVVRNGSSHHRFAGGPSNDELLGRHGSDAIAGAGGDDVLWGDSNPNGNGPHQLDVLRGGRGQDWIFSSHGANKIYAGPGNDHITAFFGHGIVDCGSGRDTVRLRPRHHGRYRVHHCEKIV